MSSQATGLVVYAKSSLLLLLLSYASIIHSGHITFRGWNRVFGSRVIGSAMSVESGRVKMFDPVSTCSVTSANNNYYYHQLCIN